MGMEGGGASSVKHPESAALLQVPTEPDPDEGFCRQRRLSSGETMPCSRLLQAQATGQPATALAWTSGPAPESPMPPFCPAVEQSQPLMLVGNKTELWPGRGGAHRPEAAGHGEQQLLRAPGVTRAPLPAPASGLPALRDQRQGRHQRGGRRRCIWLGEEPRLPRDPSPCCRIALTPLLWPCGEVKRLLGTGLSTGLGPVARRTAPRCCRTGSHSWARPGRAAARLSPGAQARPPSLHRRPPSGPEPRLRPGAVLARFAP